MLFFKKQNHNNISNRNVKNKRKYHYSNIKNFLGLKNNKIKENNHYFKQKHNKENFWFQLCWITPAFVFIVVFIFYAVFVVFKNGFNLFPYDSKFKFTFKVFKVLTNDFTFLIAIRNSILYIFIVIPISMIISIGVAYSLTKIINKKIFSFIQGIFFLPYVTSTIAIAMAFSFIFSSNSAGIFNRFISLFGFKPIAWLNNPKFAIWVVFIFGIWRTLPFQIVMLTSAFIRINPIYYQAASIDGMKKWKQFWRVSIPQIVPMLIYLITIGLITSFKFFPLGLFSSESSAEAVNAQTIVFWIYDRTTGAGGIQSNQLAGAASIILMFIILIITIMNRFISKLLSKRYK